MRAFLAKGLMARMGPAAAPNAHTLVDDEAANIHVSIDATIPDGAGEY